MRHDATRTRGRNSVVRRSLPQPEMRAVFVVVVDVFRKQPFQMAFVHSNNVIQQVSSAAFNPTLRNSILPGTFKGGAYGTNRQSTNRCRDFQPIFPIPVKDQESGSRPERKRLPQLLDGPQARRMADDVEVQDASPVVADDEEAVEQAERDRWHREEVHRGDGFSMVAQKGEPTFGWLRLSRRPFHPTGNGSLRDIEAEHKKFAMDARPLPTLGSQQPSGRLTLGLPSRSAFSQPVSGLWRSVSNTYENLPGANGPQFQA
jgi:hypothetical protein